MVLQLSEVVGNYSVVRFAPGAGIPAWVQTSGFYSVTKTADELSVVCESRVVQPGAEKVEEGWRCFRVVGTMDFGLTGVMASLTVPLAKAGISIFAVSTFDTDYLLVKEKNWRGAIEALSGAGFEFH